MKEHLNGLTAIPLKSWRTEREKLTAEKSVLTVKHQNLKDEIREVETIRRYAEGIQRTIAPTQKLRGKGLDI
jgi:hypothetical protein